MRILSKRAHVMRLVLAWSGFFLAVARADLVAEHSALSDEFIAGKWFLYLPITIPIEIFTQVLHKNIFQRLTGLQMDCGLQSGLFTPRPLIIISGA